MPHISRTFFWLSVLPALATLLGLVAYPVYLILRYSMTDFRLTRPGAAVNFVGLANYIDIMTSERFLMALLRSLYYSGLTVVFSIAIGLAVAMLLKRTDLWGLGFFKAVLLIPIQMTPLVVGAIFRHLYDYDFGMINWYMDALGLQKIAFLGSSFWAIHAAIFTEIWQWTPFAAIVLLAGLETLPTETIEAAHIDGAGFWRTLWHVQIPLLRPVMGVVVLIRFMDSFRSFDKLFMLTSGGPGTASETLSILVWRNAFQYHATGVSSAMGTVMLLVVIFLSALYVRYNRALT
jgi:multiple sugar transport system permease protein